jgi:hypothetical protein
MDKKEDVKVKSPGKFGAVAGLIRHAVADFFETIAVPLRTREMPVNDHSTTTVMSPALLAIAVMNITILVMLSSVVQGFAVAGWLAGLFLLMLANFSALMLIYIVQKRRSK